MKRILSLISALVFAFSLFSCQTVQDPTGETLEFVPDTLIPLFRVKAVEGQEEPLIKYYPTESGIAYVSKAENGYIGGYFMLPNLISNEAIFRTVEEPSAIFDMGKEKAVTFADGKVFLLSLDGGGANEFDLQGKMKFNSIIQGADGGFYYDDDEFLLRATLAFSEDYSEFYVEKEEILAKKSDIPGFTGILGVSEDGERLYYTYEENGLKKSAFFGIGYQVEKLDATIITAQKMTRIEGTTKALLEYAAEGGEVRYVLCDYDVEKAWVKEISVAAAGAYASVTVNAKDTHLIGYLADTDGTGGSLDLLEFESGKRVKHYELADLKINPSLVSTASAKYLVVGQFDDGAAYEDVGGETVTAIEVGS